MSPALSLPNRDRTAATDARVLAAGARLAPAGPIGVGRLAAEAGVSKPSARAAVRRLSARGAWPHGPLDPRPGRPTSEPVGLAERVLAAAAKLAPLGPLTGKDLARETGLPRTSVYPLICRLRARGAWKYGPLAGDNRPRAYRRPEPAPAPAPGEIPPPADVARALASARPERRPAPPRGHLDPGEAAAACRRLLRAWRRYRKGEPRPLLIAAGLLSRRKWEGDES